MNQFRLLVFVVSLIAFYGCSYVQTQGPGSSQHSTPPVILDSRIRIDGPLKSRTVVKFTPPPKSPSGSAHSVSCRAWVDPMGNVKETTYVERSSNNVEVDSAVVALIKEIKFAPLSFVELQEDQWGVFSVELKP